jgi:proline iminopeptidase
MTATFHIVPPWLLMAVQGAQVVRLDLRLVDRVELEPIADEDNSPGVTGDGATLLLSCGDVTVQMEVPEGPEAAAELVRAAASVTAGSERISSLCADGRQDPPPPVAAPCLPGVLRVLSSTLDASLSPSDPFAGRHYEFTGPRLCVGRAADNDIVIEHSSISAHHAQLERDPATGRYSIVDLQATNGVYINGRACERAILHEGDLVDLGSLRMRFFARFDLHEAPPHVDRFVWVGGDAVRVTAGSVTIGPEVFSVETVDAVALSGGNLTTASGDLLQAAVARLVIAAAQRETPTPFADFWTARTGVGDGPPIVWLHGAHGLWDRLDAAAALTDEICASYRYDQRGCRRTRASGASTLAQHVADLEALRAQWGHDRIIVAGHELGAIRALHYALAHPERVAGLVLFGTDRLTAGGHEAFRKEAALRVGAEASARFEALLRQMDANPSVETELAMLEIIFAPDGVEPALVREQFIGRASDNMDTWLDLAADHARLITAAGFFDRLHALPIPTLIVHGERDARPAWAARELAGKLARAKLLLVPDAGHFPWLDAPAMVSAELRSFIDGCRVASP